MICSRAEIVTACSLAAGPLSNTDLALINYLHGKSERLVKKFVGFNVEQDTYIQYLPVSNYHAPQDVLVTGYESIGNRATPIFRFDDSRRILQLSQLPVRSITSIFEDYGAWQTFPPTFKTQLSQGQDFYLDIGGEYNSTANPSPYPQPGKPEGIMSWTGFVIRWSGIWANFDRSIKATYVAGLTPQELQTDFPEFSQAVAETVLFNFNQYRAHAPSVVQINSPGAVVSEALDGMTHANEPQTAAYNFGFMVSMPRSAKEKVEDRINYSKYF